MTEPQEQNGEANQWNGGLYNITKFSLKTKVMDIKVAMASHGFDVCHISSINKYLF